MKREPEQEASAREAGIEEIIARSGLPAKPVQTAREWAMRKTLSTPDDDVRGQHRQRRVRVKIDPGMDLTDFFPPGVIDEKRRAPLD